MSALWHVMHGMLGEVVAGLLPGKLMVVEQ